MEICTSFYTRKIYCKIFFKLTYEKWLYGTSIQQNRRLHTNGCKMSGEIQ